MRRLSPKRRQLVEEAYRLREEFRLTFPTCMIPWCRHVCVAVHEIARGPARSQAFSRREALLALCGPCHEALHGTEWPVVRQLALKAIADPEFFDPALVNRLRGRQPDATSARDIVLEMLGLIRLALPHGWHPKLPPLPQYPGSPGELPMSL
jgi:hypothetical protein